MARPLTTISVQRTSAIGTEATAQAVATAQAEAEAHVETKIEAQAPAAALAPAQARRWALADNTRLRGGLVGVLMVVIWSGWFTLSRYGARSQLSAYDITAFRFGTAALVTAPLWRAYPWRRVRWGRALFVALGCGFPYTLLAFHGLRTAGAAEAGVWINGSLPALTAILSVVWLRHSPPRKVWLTCGVVLVANLCVSGQLSSTWHWDGERLLGIGQLLLAAWVLALYMTAVRVWSFALRDVIVLVPMINAALFLPVWWFALPSSASSAPLSELVLQAGYQGVLVSVLGLVLFTDCIKTLGLVASALFMASVPALTAVMAWLVLGEALSTGQIAGIALCSLALAHHAVTQAPPTLPRAGA